ncbi:MAG TPA: type VI secretion system-associated FHA domain protein TagH [Vicinamibacterales bacterium]|jgi:type VI secretion system FHA domain protein|nr:type VI secretion system-associated FHA domain protein TagH [Vicinamibacterales bacterium]
MILTLEITGRDGTPPAESRKAFPAKGGTIGRLPENDWVLPDPYVSSRHARIRYANGVFHIEDTNSANGVFINSLENRLTRGQPYALKSGDRIFIEPYEIRASISAEPAKAIDDPFALDSFDRATPPPAVLSSAPPIIPVDPLTSSSGEVDPLRALGFDAPPQQNSRAPKAADLARGSVLSEHYQPPPVPVPPPPRSAGPIPPDYDPLGSDSHPPFAVSPAPAKPSVESRARNEPSRPVAPSPGRGAANRATGTGHGKSASPDVSLAAVLAGAGIDSSVVTPELAQNFGQILRVVVAGVIDVLQARQRLKDEFRMRVTTFKAAQNNPLKFSANVDDALYNLLVKRNAAFLGPVEAFEDAFDDVKNHQMAMLAGVRVAFEAILTQFHPDRLQEEFDRQARGSLVPGKLRYWEQYRDKFNDMVSDADASFRDLFGEEFAKAYEQQLERLKARERGQTP